MAIMQTCCCWRSVRRGSFACAVYTVFYYSVIAVTLASLLQEESQYLTGNSSRPKSNSVLEAEVSHVTMRFNIALLICSSLGVIGCLLLLYGLFKDEKMYLVPWICIIIACCVVDISHLIYVFGAGLKFNPVTAMVLTVDFFLLCINIYSALCVISQYQEYAAGRGTATHDARPQKVPAVRYTVQPTATATSCLSSRRPTTTTNDSRTPMQSPTTYLTIVHPPPSTERLAPPGGELKIPPRKHVKFPDAIQNHDIIEKIDETYAIQFCPAEESDDDEEDDDEEDEEDEDEVDYYRRRRRKNGTAKNGGV